MRNTNTLLAAVASMAMATPAVALEVTSGMVVRVDRERQVVRLHTGKEFHLTNSAFMSRFSPRPKATIWYRVVDGKNVVVHFDTELIELN
ncbi:MAG: hypothetical protein AAGK37_19610 [Pseudomonadota bacterium]